MAQLYAQKTVRIVARIKEQQLRSWKTKVNVGQLDEPNALFDFAELLTLSIISLLVNDLGMKIGAVAPFSEQLYEACASEDIDSLKTRAVVLSPVRQRCLVRPLAQMGSEALEVVISMNRVIDDIVARLVDVDHDATLPLFANVRA